MEISKELREKFREEFKKKGAEYTEAEETEAINNLTGFFELLYDFAKRDAILNKRLKKEPKGFPIEHGYSCAICGNGIQPPNGWWDYYGPKCLLCQKAINDGVIPAYIAKFRDSYFTVWRLAHSMNVKTNVVRKYLKEGRLKARLILNEDGKVHEHIFLRRDNPDLICPNNPVRKSYDRNRDKKHKKWVREKSAEWKAEMEAERKKLAKKYSR